MAKSIDRIKEEILGVVSVLFSIYLALSLYSYSKWDASFFTFTTNQTKNYGGVFGAYSSDFLISIFGFSAFLIPLALIAFGIRRLFGIEKRRVYLLGSMLLIFSASLMLSLLLKTFHISTESGPGGITGSVITGLLENYLSDLGAYLFSLSLFLSAIILLIPASLSPDILKRKKSVPETKKKKGLFEDEVLLKESEPDDEPIPEIIEAMHSIEPEAEPDSAVSADDPAVKRTLRTKDGYALPSIEFLTLYEPIKTANEEILITRQNLQKKLEDFGVDGVITTNVEPGPVVTLYKFEPAPGVKINKVVTLSDDLALALKAPSIRISPIAGENAIGIEVPNKKRELLSLRDIISSDLFSKSHSRLTLALGKDIAGRPVVADLTKMPHLLVAGATGTGKSVSINSMIMSILYKSSPKEVKMLMIDPKLIELSIYGDIPHLISPVITNPKQAAEALRKMVFEMERRYRLLAEKGARNIDAFNSSSPEEDRMPYIVIFIDELADLMFASSREVEDSITRLAQMARAAGMHLIIGTQRPSVDVITGIIKANLPSRISFKVTSKIDSRTILDTQGAEQLLDKGDMLLMLSGAGIKRVHGALVTEEEIKSAIDFIKSQGSPDYSLFEQIPLELPAESESSFDDRDDMYYKSVEFGEAVGEVSISSLQRRFKIGYNRAARIMEMMEDDGLVGPPKGAGKPRDFIRRQRL